MDSPLKKLTQSVFDGLPSEYQFAAVDANGWAWAYEEQPDMISFDGVRRFISRRFDVTDWKNSLIERKEGENLFKDSIDSDAEIIALKKQRDELLNILQRLEEVDFGEHWNSGAEQAAIAARELIRKFEVESDK